MKHDILAVNEESLTVEVVGGKINSSRNKNISKKGVRLFENNKIRAGIQAADWSS